MKKKIKRHKPSRFAKKKANKNDILHDQVLGLGPKIVNSVIIALDEEDYAHIRKIVEGLSEYDLAKLLEVLGYNHRQQLIDILGDQINPDVFPELNDVVQEQIIDGMDEKQIAHIVNELDSDEAVEILEHLDDDEQKSVISKLSPELKQQVKSSLSYPEDSAGRIMSRDFVSMPDSWTVSEAKKYLLKEQDLPEDFYDIFLVDENLHPTGQIALDKLLRAKPSEKLYNIMNGEVVPIEVYTDQEEVAHMFREYGWMSAMVVDKKRRLIGTITIDDVIDVVHEEASEDILHLSGTEEGDIYRSVGAIFKSRAVWLVTNLFATIIASSVVRGFEDIIAQLSVLAVLMPIVASMGGTTGQQTLAVVVRAIATRELTSRNTIRMIFKEFMVGVCNGLLFAMMIAAITAVLFPGQIKLSIIIAVAMLINLSIASLAGILIPITLNKLKADPAIASGVFLIAITDSGGYFIFLGLASLFLV